MALTDSEIADITMFLGYPSLQNFDGVKTRVIQTLAIVPTLAAYRENQVRDLLKQINQYKKDIRASEQNYGMVRQPGVVINSAERLSMLISSGRNAVAELSAIIDVAIADDIFSRGRGMGSVKVSRG